MTAEPCPRQTTPYVIYHPPFTETICPVICHSAPREESPYCSSLPRAAERIPHPPHKCEDSPFPYGFNSLTAPKEFFAAPGILLCASLRARLRSSFRSS